MFQSTLSKIDSDDYSNNIIDAYYKFQSILPTIDSDYKNNQNTTEILYILYNFQHKIAS